MAAGDQNSSKKLTEAELEKEERSLEEEEVLSLSYLQLRFLKIIRSAFQGLRFLEFITFTAIFALFSFFSLNKNCSFQALFWCLSLHITYS